MLNVKGKLSGGLENCLDVEICSSFVSPSVGWLNVTDSQSEWHLYEVDSMNGSYISSDL